MDLVKNTLEIIEKIKPTGIYKERLSLKEGLLCIGKDEIDLFEFSGINIVGVGKAAALSVEELYKFLAPIKVSLKKGLAATKYEHAIDSEYFNCLESAHPTPDENSLKSAQTLLDHVAKLPADDLLIVCLSGGASAVAVAPVPAFDLSFKQQVAQELLSGGVPIEEMNKIRRELSFFKNGGLAAASGTKRVLVLAISDIPSGDMSMIGSGPCFFERYPKKELAALAKSHLSTTILESFHNYLNSKEREQNLAVRELALGEKQVDHHLICDFHILMETAQKVIKRSTKKGPRVINTPLVGDIEEGALSHLEDLKPLLQSGGTLVTGGEYTVNVKGKGIGGRNHEFVLLLTKLIFLENRLDLDEKQLARISFLSAGTDGTDGMTSAAGSYMDYDRYNLALEKNLDIIRYLNENDSYSFFNQIDSVIDTGATQTNVMDLRLIHVKEA